MICPVTNKDLMATISRYLLKAQKKPKVGEAVILKSISYGEPLFQNFTLNKFAENFASIICFCAEYQYTIANYVNREKRTVKDISISIADALFELKFNFTLPNLLQLNFFWRKIYF